MFLSLLPQFYWTAHLHFTDVLGLSLESSPCKQSPLTLCRSLIPPPLPLPLSISAALSPPRFHTIEHAACSSYSLASETLDIFRAVQIHTNTHQHWLDEGCVLPKLTLGIGSDKKEGEKESSSSRTHRTQGKWSIFIYWMAVLCNSAAAREILALRGICHS